MKKYSVILVSLLLITSSCKELETSALELDKSEIVLINGMVSVENDGTIPADLEVILVVNNTEYNPAAPGGGQQFFYTALNSDGSFSYELPVRKRTNTSESTQVMVHLTPFVDSDGYKYGGTTNFTIEFLDVEKSVTANYTIENKRTLSGQIRNNDGIALPPNMTVKYTSSNGMSYSVSLSSPDDYTGSIANYSLEVAEENSTNYNNLELNPLQYIDAGTSNTYVVSASSSNFYYERN